jgi:3-deoxy-D-manno-octulosonic-acid transferase
MWFYRFFISIFGLLWKIHGFFNEDTALRHRIMEDQWQGLENLHKAESGEKRYWMHCASLGEFEQGRSVLELIQNSEPDAHITLSFFSPSGYRLKEKIICAHEIIYLPLDNIENAKRIIKCLKPQLFIGVKYDFWWNLLNELQKQNIKSVWISLQLSEKQYFFHPIFKSFFNIFSNIDYFCTIDTATADILRRKNIGNHAYCGDTRIDSVVSRKEKSVQSKAPKILKTDRPIIIYGSVYPQDFHYLGTVTRMLPGYFHVFIPHKIDEQNCSQIFKVLEVPPVYEEKQESNYMMIAKIGLLFDLYKEADLAYIGGGFGKSIHNTLEPAVFGLPLSFGPKIRNFKEAKDFLTIEAAKIVHNPTEFRHFIESYSSEPAKNRVRQSLSGYFEENLKAAEMCFQIIKKISYE